MGESPGPCFAQSVSGRRDAQTEEMLSQPPPARFSDRMDGMDNVDGMDGHSLRKMSKNGARERHKEALYHSFLGKHEKGKDRRSGNDWEKPGC